MVAQNDSGNTTIQGRNWPLSDRIKKVRKCETKQHFVYLGAARKQLAVSSRRGDCRNVVQPQISSHSVCHGNCR